MRTAAKIFTIISLVVMWWWIPSWILNLKLLKKIKAEEKPSVARLICTIIFGGNLIGALLAFFAK